MSNYVDGSKKFSSEKTYSVISRIKVNECLGNRELLFRRYLSNGLHCVIDEGQFKEYLVRIGNHFNKDKLFYEIAYCRLYQMGIEDLRKPIMTIPKIWRFCGLITTNHGCNNVADAMRIAKPKKV